MKQTPLRFRQVHLDFHTSELIEGIGALFDPDDFAETLKKAHVDSITCFGRCHHGWIYYDTQAFPERRHPHLTQDLLKEQIEACHARDIRVPIYITVQWDHYTAQRHPEWLVIDENGTPIGTPLYEAGFYRRLCVNSPYVEDFLKPHLQELLELLPTDGIFFDIVSPMDCSCRYCRELMKAQGLEPSDPVVRKAFGLQTINKFKQEMTAYVQQYNSEATIFYNPGHVGTRHRAAAGSYTHFELESLPSGDWGYLHFPMSIRYARNLGLSCLGMTGKFHTTWGDFHSFKNPAALQFECFQMLAQGAQCSIGDQLHPSGEIDKEVVYDLIGSVYESVAAKEPWCLNARPLAEIGILTPEEFGLTGQEMRLPPSLMGITRMLEEGAQQFDILDSHSDFLGYSVIILPDVIPVSDELAVKLEAYLETGGALIASFESGMDADKSNFVLDALGVQLKSDGAKTPDGIPVRGRSFPSHDYVDYLLPTEALNHGLHNTQYTMYMRGVEVEAKTDSQTLAESRLPYFDRSYKGFCSHRQTPSSSMPGPPAVVRNGKTIYFAHPIFTQYNQNAPRWCKALFLNALALLLPEPLVRHNGPSTLRVSLTEQKDEDRWIIHLLHYIPERRGQDFDVIEDVIPLYNLEISIRNDRDVVSVSCVPENSTIGYAHKDERLTFTLKKLVGHQMISISFK